MQLKRLLLPSYWLPRRLHLPSPRRILCSGMTLTREQCSTVMPTTRTAWAS